MVDGIKYAGNNHVLYHDAICGDSSTTRVCCNQSGEWGLFNEVYDMFAQCGAFHIVRIEVGVFYPLVEEFLVGGISWVGTLFGPSGSSVGFPLLTVNEVIMLGGCTPFMEVGEGSR